MTSNNLGNQVIRSIFFKNAQKKAGKYTRNAGTIYFLLKEVLAKVNQQSGNHASVFKIIQEKISILARMLKAYAKGEYRVLPWKSVMSVVAVLVYFLSPIDLVPDFLPVIGFSDDLALVWWLFRSIRGDIDHFLLWEQSKQVF